MTIMNEMQINDGNAPRYSAADIANNMVDTDWQDEVFNYDAPVQQHQLSINGGNDKMTYFLSWVISTKKVLLAVIMDVPIMNVCLFVVTHL